MKHLAAAIVASCLASWAAQAAGLKEIEIAADANGPAIQALILTPCVTPPTEVKLLGGRLVLPGVAECPIVDDKLPLIVISHSLGGWFASHLDTAQALADGGFVVVALNHPRDSGLDMTKANDKPALTERPTDIKRLIDYMLQSSPVMAKIDPERIGFFGFSRGGYAGLVLAGAVPRYPMWLSVWWQIADWASQSPEPPRLPVNDSRIKAFVIADPLSFSPDGESLQMVTAPLQLWGSQYGGQSVTPEKVAAVASSLRARPEFHSVPNSTHMSYLMPCTPALAKVAGEACIDPAGFDRAAFHEQFNAQVLTFFRKNLSE